MSRKKIPRFKRVVVSGEEPTDHQRNFLYLPWLILRDYTNIGSIIEEHHGRTDGKKLTNFQQNQKIKLFHSKLGQLNMWNEWHFDQLDFLLPASERV